MTRPSTRLVLLSLLAALVSACGGGGSDGASASGSTSSETAQSASANGVVIADDGVRAQGVVLSTARAVIAAGSASTTVACAGGGTALFIASGGAAGSLTNGVLDAGEVYTMQFASCRNGTDSTSVTGALTLAVNSSSGENVSVSTSSQLIVAMPDRTLSFNGSSTLSHTVQTSGATQVTTDRWVTPMLSMTSTRNNRPTILSLSNVDLSHTVTTTNGVVTGSSSQGTITMTYTGLVGSWSATIATQGIVTFDANGVPLLGQWQITLPNDLIALQVAGGLATAALDFGRNGSVDRLFSWPVLVLAAVAD